MNFLGMGPLEILVVLLIAFIFLGPQKMVDAARWMGKATREVRRVTDEFNTMVVDEVGTPAKSTSTGASADKTVADALPPAQSEASASVVENDGPVPVSTRNSQEPAVSNETEDTPSGPAPHI